MSRCLTDTFHVDQIVCLLYLWSPGNFMEETGKIYNSVLILA